MENIKVINIVKGNTAKFIYAAAGVLYYKILGDTHTYIFPIDLSKESTTRFEAEYNAIRLMRWINASIENNSIISYPNPKVTE